MTHKIGDKAVYQGGGLEGRYGHPCEVIGTDWATIDVLKVRFDDGVAACVIPTSLTFDPVEMANIQNSLVSEVQES